MDKDPLAELQESARAFRDQMQEQTDMLLVKLGEANALHTPEQVVEAYGRLATQALSFQKIVLHACDEFYEEVLDLPGSLEARIEELEYQREDSVVYLRDLVDALTEVRSTTFDNHVQFGRRERHSIESAYLTARDHVTEVANKIEAEEMAKYPLPPSKPPGKGTGKV